MGEEEQKVNRQIERLGDERNQALKERDHYREIVRKLREAIREYAENYCILDPDDDYDPIACEQCTVARLCRVEKEAV